MKRYFPKRVKRHLKKKGVSNVNPKFVDCVLKKALFINVYIRSLNLALIFETHILEWRLTRLGKALFIWKPSREGPV